MIKRQIVQGNEKLSEDEQEKILDKLIDNNGGQWTPKQTNEKFRQLLFMHLGVLTFNVR